MQRLALVLSIAAFITGSLTLKAYAAMDDYPIARLRMLDKVTARTSTFDVRVDTTVRFGQLYIRPRACRKAPPIETPESASFMQIWEVTTAKEPKWVFSGWMFASSPALSSMDHPIYDVWVLDCITDAPMSTLPTGAEQATGEMFGPPAPDFSSSAIDYSSSTMDVLSHPVDAAPPEERAIEPMTAPVPLDEAPEDGGYEPSSDTPYEEEMPAGTETPLPSVDNPVY